MEQPQEFNLFDAAKSKIICPECREEPANITIEYSSGDVVCTSCGLILQGTVIDTRTEWRSFREENKAGAADPNRVGDAMNPLLMGEGLKTHIGGDQGQASAIALAHAQRMIPKSAEERGNQKMLEGFSVIESLCASGGFGTTVVDSSKHWFSLSVKGGWFNSYPTDVFLGFIFWGCKTGNHPRTASELASLSGNAVTKKSISKAATRINNKFMQNGVDPIALRKDGGPKVRKDPRPPQQSPRMGSTGVTTAAALIPRFCHKLGDIPVWAETIASAISEALRDTMALDSRGAANVATCAIYLMLHLVAMPRHWDNVYTVSGLGKGQSSR